MLRAAVGVEPAVSAHFHKYGDLCCGRCGHGFKALRRVDTEYRRGEATKKTGVQRRNPLGGGGLWSISSSLVVDDVRTSPPSRSSTSPHKPPPQMSPYLWKGAPNPLLLWLSRFLLSVSCPTLENAPPQPRNDCSRQIVRRLLSPPERLFASLRPESVSHRLLPT